MKRVVLLSYSDHGAGAHTATRKIFEALKESREETGWAPILRVIRSDQVNDDVVRGYPRLGTINTVLRNFALWSRKFWKLCYRLLGGKNVHSSAGIRTGVGREISELRPDVVLVNWIGDYTVSLGEIGQIESPVILRNSDFWYFSKTNHFEAPLAITAVTGWEKILSQVFFGAEAKCTKLRKEVLLRRACAMVFPSDSMRQRVVEENGLPLCRTTVIPNPINADSWFPENREGARREMGLGDSGLIVGFGAVGGMSDPRKGGDLLTAALMEVAKAAESMSEDVEFHFFGGKRGVIELPGLRLVGHGVLNPSELRSFYSAVDVFVVPSRAEGFSNVAAEAQACGTPVVGFKIGGLQEVSANPENLLAAPFDSRDLAAKILNLLSDSEKLKHAGLSASQFTHKNYSPENIAKLLCKLFDSCASQV